MRLYFDAKIKQKSKSAKIKSKILLYFQRCKFICFMQVSDSKTVKGRILLFVKSQGIKKSEFERKCMLSNGYLNSVNNIGSKKIEQMLVAYPELNREWLLFGSGDMLNEKPNKEPQNTANIVGDVSGTFTQTINAPKGRTMLDTLGYENPMETIKQALNEIAEMRKALVETVRQNQEITERLLSYIEKIPKDKN